MRMTGSQIFLTMLKLYDTEYVFGLPGETTLALYKHWAHCPDVKHILTHDERAAAYMAEAYAKVTGKVGISEAPSPGGAHPAPGVLESYCGSVPTICFTSDVPYNNDKRNMLSGFDQNKLYSAITKESILATRASDLPFIIRRAFRVALSGRPGAVHVRIPMDVHKEEIDIHESELYADPRGSLWPSTRPVADIEQIEAAIKLLSEAKRPVIVCGQGAVVSGAGDAVRELAEHFNIPVGCTMTGKGTISEKHPLSIRLIGARGGTSYANNFLKNADLVFFIGSNTDSAGTDGWQLPDKNHPPKIIHLDICGIEAGNSYKIQVPLIGDAKATVEYMLARIKQEGTTGIAENGHEAAEAMDALDNSITEEKVSKQTPIHPIRFMKELEALLPEKSYIVTEPSVGSIFSAAYIIQERPGRMFLSNYSQGALGYVVPACAAAAVGAPEATVIGLGGDGSFHFNCGELETYARLGVNVKLVIFNNNVFGWIKGETAHVYNADFFATDFGSVDYAAVARGFGVKAFTIDDPEKITDTLKEAFAYKGPTLIQVMAPDESMVVPPVPRWVGNAAKKGLPYTY